MRAKFLKKVSYSLHVLYIQNTPRSEKNFGCGVSANNTIIATLNVIPCERRKVNTCGARAQMEKLSLR